MKTLNYIWQMMLYRPILYLFDNLVWLLMTIVELVPGVVSKLFFDILTGDQPFRFGVTGVVIMLLVYELVHQVLIITGALLDTNHRFRMSALLRRNLLSHVLKRPGAIAIPGSTGEALNTFRDDAGQIEDIISWSIDQFCVVGFAIAALTIMLRIDVRITLITTIPLFIIILIARLTGSRVGHYREMSRHATEQVSGALGEILASVQAIQVANAEGSVINHLAGLNTVRQKLVIKDRLLTQILDSIYNNAGALGTGLILVLVAESIKDQSFSMGDFSLFVYNLSLLTLYFTDFGDYLAHNKQAAVSFTRMTTFVQNQPPEMQAHEAAEIVVGHHPLHLRGALYQIPAPNHNVDKPLQSLDIKGLSYLYPSTDVGGNHRSGIQDINMQIERGNFVVITGQIGSGKTTLLRVLLGLLPAEQGEIFWNDQLITHPETFFVPPHAAYTAQIPQLFSESLANNILMGLPQSAVNLESAIYHAVLEQDIGQLPDGMETVVGTRGIKLSGGQRQRVAAARMFVRQPELLVFDDLSSALDVKTEHLLWERLFEGRAQGDMPTCLVVSHRHLAFRRADQIIILKDGQISATGNVESLLSASPEFRHIWGLGADENGNSGNSSG